MNTKEIWVEYVCNDDGRMVQIVCAHEHEPPTGYITDGHHQLAPVLIYLGKPSLSDHHEMRERLAAIALRQRLTDADVALIKKYY